MAESIIADVQYSYVKLNKTKDASQTMTLLLPQKSIHRNTKTSVVKERRRIQNNIATSAWCVCTLIQEINKESLKLLYDRKFILLCHDKNSENDSNGTKKIPRDNGKVSFKDMSILMSIPFSHIVIRAYSDWCN